MNVQRALVLGSVVGLAGATGYVGIRAYRHVQYPKWYETVASGDTEATVHARMGSPDAAKVEQQPFDHPEGSHQMTPAGLSPEKLE